MPQPQFKPCGSDPNYYTGILLPNPQYYGDSTGDNPQVHNNIPQNYYQGQPLPNPQYHQNLSREYVPPYDNIPQPSIPVMNTTSPNPPAQDIHQPHIPHVPPGNAQPLPHVLA